MAVYSCSFRVHSTAKSVLDKYEPRVIWHQRSSRRHKAYQVSNIHQSLNCQSVHTYAHLLLYADTCTMVLIAARIEYEDRYYGIICKSTPKYTEYTAAVHPQHCSARMPKDQYYTLRSTPCPQELLCAGKLVPGTILVMC